MRMIRIVMVMVCCVAGFQANAAEAPAYRQIHFQVERNSDVVNDRMQVRMQAEAEHKDPARLARLINDTMQWALNTAGDRDGVRIATGNYQTYPVRAKEKVTGWRASQELRIHGSNMPAISELVGELQERLQVKSMGFSVSDDSRRDAEDLLIDDALQALQHRAQRIQRSLGATGYQLVQVNIQTGGHRPGPVPVMRAQLAATEMSMPVVDAGETQVQVTISASIELQMP